jgi:alkanesulfonate monooxygenase SsuD/methylene tetrahydromethanopterin reductase-like flavin-dependent oxidoreductase (luciferase family)
VLSKGRALLGIGIGWMEDEFRALGIPFDERRRAHEEACAALRTLWKPGAHAFKSDHYAWEAIESNPKPVQPGGVPIIVGGHVLGAARRAARVGDGFFPMKTGGSRLRELLAALSDECAKVGRDPTKIEITTAAPGPDLDAIRRLEDQGVSRLVIGPPGSTATRCAPGSRSRRRGAVEAPGEDDDRIPLHGDRRRSARRAGTTRPTS